MSDKRIREYYERLSRARVEFAQEVDAQHKHFWSGSHRYRFKEKLRELVLNKIKKKAGQIVLDIGCGSGSDFLAIAKEKIFFGYGLDFSLSQLEQAASNDELKGFRWVQAEVDYLPFKDSSYDIVIFSEVIEHLTDCSKSLSDIHRILKKDGYLFLTTPNRYDYYHFLGTFFPKKIRKSLRNSLQDNADIDSGEYSSNFAEHVHLFTFKELLKKVESHNFQLEAFQPGMLSVPIPRLFDRYRFLQALWETVDCLTGKIPLSKSVRANFILVLKKAD